MRTRIVLAIILLVVGLCFVPALAFVVFLFKLPSTKAAYLANLLVASGTISMALIILYIEVIKPWLREPRITIEFDNKAPLCRCATPEGTQGSRDYVRIKVTNAGNSVAKAVRGKLVEVNSGNVIIDEFIDPLFLHWTSIEPLRGLGKLGFQASSSYVDSIDLNAKEWDYLDVFSTNDKEKGLISITTSPQPRGCLKQFWMKQSAILKVTIYGENMKPVPKIYELVWMDHNKIAMFEKKKREVKNGVNRKEKDLLLRTRKGG